MTNKLVSIIIPAFNESGNVFLITKKICESVSKYNFEILFINDGSRDNTLDKIKMVAKKNKRVKYLSFSRNFGHQNALKAGLDVAKGECVISMDADLQHPPELLPKLIKLWEEGNDVVYTIRKDENTPLNKILLANLFYRLINKLTDVEIHKGAADFRLMDRKVVNVIKNLSESVLFLRGIVTWCGFKSAYISYIPNTRFSGKTKYSFKKMLFFAIDGITSFSVKPLRISMIVGLFFSFVSGLYGIFALYSYLFQTRVISGWTSMIVSILFFGGIQLIILGILGEYLGKIFIETKKRPLYIVNESNYLN